MVRQMGFALAILLSLATGGVHAAQSEQQRQASKQQDNKPKQDRRPWWKDDKVRAEVGFSLEQAAEIDKIFQSYIEKARPLRDEINQLDKTIDRMIVSRDTDMAVFNHTVEKVEARRAELNKARTLALYRIRRIFTAEQNAKFQAWHDRREAAQRKSNGDRRK